jgi:membrane-associated protein
MDYKKFMFFNITGAVLWVGTLLPAGWYFGGFPIVKENFELVVFAIIGISILPMVIEIARAKLKRQPPPDVTLD